MKISIKTPKYVVVDDLLTKEQFDRLWVHIQNEKYSVPHNSASGWLKVWRLGDANCLGGPSYYLTKKPFNSYMDAVSSYMLAACKYADSITGEQNHDWEEASFRPYLYPRNTKLSWHNDAGGYHAALTYYVHPHWGSTWGGELMVADVPPMETLVDKPQIAPHLDHKWEDEYIATKGVGQWIFPKPNRLVIMAGGVYHSINRVDADAGDHVRASVVGFLFKRKPEENCLSNSCAMEQK